MLGRRLLGRYRIVRELARGGMGVVYLARAEGAEGFVKPVVVKLILKELAAEQRFLQMFAREAKILATLRDPSIVDVIEFDQHDGDYVMVLEYVRGYHLGQWKKYLRKLGRQVPTDIILQIAIDILGALHHAHNAKHPDGELMHIVHRDVSPSNILLDSDGRGRLLDFGVARMRGGADQYRTQVKSVVGKLPYLSPELLSGQDATAKSDLYAVAVVVHEILYGKNVFRGENDATTLYRVMHHDPEPVSRRRDDVPAGLDDVLARALAKKPEDRFESAAEFQRALRALAPHPEHEVRERLARLLEQDFGDGMARALGLESLAERDEAWRRLSLLPEGTSGRGEDEEASHTRETSAQRRFPSVDTSPRISRIPPPPPSGATVISGQYGIDSANVMTDPALRTWLEQQSAQYNTATGSNRAVLLISLMALGLAGVAAFLMWQDSRASGHPAAPPPPIQVVQQPAPSAEPPEPSQPETVAVKELEPEAEQEEKEPEKQAQPKPRPAKPSRAKPATSGPQEVLRTLTRAFRRKLPGVHQCIDSHADVVDAGRIEIEFSIDAQGNLQKARVLPHKVAVTSLGQCITQVAQGAQFPGQGKPLTFAIPVTLKAVR